MTNFVRNTKGFTLLEIIVVLAVLGALAAALSAVVFRYIDDANRTRTQADVTTIARAIQAMHADTSRWPFYKIGTGPVAFTPAHDAFILTSNDSCDMGDADIGVCDPAAPDDNGQTIGWNTSGVKADSLTNQLIKGSGGTPYATTGPRAWRGRIWERCPKSTHGATATSSTSSTRIRRTRRRRGWSCCQLEPTASSRRTRTRWSPRTPWSRATTSLPV